MHLSRKRDHPVMSHPLLMKHLQLKKWQILLVRKNSGAIKILIHVAIILDVMEDNSTSQVAKCICKKSCNQFNYGAMVKLLQAGKSLSTVTTKSLSAYKMILAVNLGIKAILDI